MADLTGDGVNDVDITHAGDSATIGGAIFTDAVKVGSGTGGYNTFLAISDNNDAGASESGFNTDDTPPIDPSNPEIDQAKTHTVLLSSLVVKTVNGVQYYEFRVDLNEANSGVNSNLSLDQFKLYSSSSGSIESLTTLQSQNVVYDMDAGGNISVLLSDAGSTGSGTDDYSILVPVSNFAGLDPTSTYIYLYVQMGAAGADWGANATFEEWNIENGVALTGVKFNDLNGNGVRDAGEAGVAGVTIYIDANKNGTLDVGERTTVTDANGNYTFYGVTTDQTVWIDEDMTSLPAGVTQTTGDHETVVIAKGATGTIVVDPIGNHYPVPNIHLEKGATVAGGSADAGETINYTLDVTNTGDVALTGIAITDPYADGGSIQPVLSGGFNSGDTNHNNQLDLTETWHYTATHTVTQAEVDSNGGGNGALENTATVTSTQGVSDDDDASVPVHYNPGIHLEKAASVAGGSADAGELIQYTLDVSNTGNVTLTNIQVSDSYADAGSIQAVLVGGFNSGDTDQDGKLDLTETWHYTATHTVTQAEIDSNGGGNGQLENTALATADQGVSDDDNASVPVDYNPDIHLEKAASVDGGSASAGELINYTLDVSNTGNVTLTNIQVNDPYADIGSIEPVLSGGFNTGDTNMDGKLDLTETWHYTATHTVTQAEVDSNGGGNGQLENTALATADQGVSDDDNASVPVDYNPAIHLEKGATVAGGSADPGEQINYTLDVSNTGDVTLTNIQVSDPYADLGSIQPVLSGGFNTGDTNQDGKLDLTETWHYTATHTVTQAEVDSNGGGNGQLENTAVASSDQNVSDDDNASVPVDYNPAIHLEKEASVDGGSADPGELIHYTLDVSNTGNVTLTNIQVSDSYADPGSIEAVIVGGFNSGDTDQDGKLDTNETWHYTATHTVTQAEVDSNGGGNGQLENTALVTSDQGVSDDDDASVPVDFNPAIHLEKVASVDGGSADAGELINYTLDVSNTGNVALTGITITDPYADGGSIQPVLAGGFNTGDTNMDGKLDTTETWHYTATHTVTQAEIDSNGGGDGNLENTATVTSDQNVSDDDDASVPVDYNPDIHLEKAASVDGGSADPGELIHYTLDVSNTGNVTLTNIQVSDSYADSGSIEAVIVGGFNSGDTNMDGKLDLTETWHYTATHTVTQAEVDSNGDGDGNLENTALATADQGVSDDDNASVPVDYNPGIHLEKEASVDGGSADPGELINYTLDVSNTGNVTLTNIQVADPYADLGSIQPVLSGGFNTGDTNMDGKLDLTETWHYTATHTVTQAEVDSNGGGDGQLENTAVASSDQNVSDDDDASVPVDANPEIHLEKVASVAGGSADPGELINYTLDVSNTGNVTLTNIQVNDPYADAGSIQPVLSGGFNTGDTNMDGKLDLTETWHYTATHTVTQAEVDSNGGGDGQLENTAVASSDQNVSDDDSASVPVDYNPQIHLEKAASVDGGSADPGELIHYTLDVSNTGNVTLTNIQVSDPYADLGSIEAVLVGGFNSGDTNQDGKLDLTETWHYTATHTVTQAEVDSNGGGDGDLENTALATADQGVSDDDDASVPVDYNPAIHLEKAASVAGGTASAGELINYTLDVSNTGNVTLTNIQVSDPYADLGSIEAVLVGGFNSGDTNQDGKLDLTETWHYTATHTVTQAEVDSNGDGDGQLENTAVASSDQNVSDDDSASVPVDYSPGIHLEKDASVPGGTADTPGELISYTLDVSNTGDVTLTNIQISDPYADAGSIQPVLSGGFNTGDTNMDGKLDLTETWHYTATHTVTLAELTSNGGGDGMLENTATVTSNEGASDDDDASVPVVVPSVGPCPRTPGFWQNMKNGGSFWDGIQGNEKHAGEHDFPTGELLYAVDSNNDGSINGSDQAGLLIGDWNKNGLTDAGEDTLFISYADARTLINASNKQLANGGGDGKFMLGRDMVAAWLNYEMGSGFGDASDPNSPTSYLQDAINFMQIYSGATGGTSVLDETFDKFVLSGAIKSSTSLWKTAQPGVDHSGAQLHGALDYYNNTGMTSPGGTIYAMCSDDVITSATTAMASMSTVKAAPINAPTAFGHHFVMSAAINTHDFGSHFGATSLHTFDII